VGSNGDASRAFPFRHGFEAVKMGGKSGAAGMGWNEEIADSRKDTDKPLQTSWCPEALHHPLSSTQEQMRVLRTVVEALMGAVFSGYCQVGDSSGPVAGSRA
jgi:hypothetical protein